MTKTRGFTLIELLIVVAIIGVMSAIVLGALSSARTRGTDASIKSTMNSAPAAAQLYYDVYNNSSWTGVCSSDNGLNKIMTKLSQITTAACNGTGQSGWRAHALLKETNKYWCLDYLGTKKVCDNVPTGFTCAAGC